MGLNNLSRAFIFYVLSLCVYSSLLFAQNNIDCNKIVAQTCGAAPKSKSKGDYYTWDECKDRAFDQCLASKNQVSKQTPKAPAKPQAPQRQQAAATPSAAKCQDLCKDEPINSPHPKVVKCSYKGADGSTREVTQTCNQVNAQAVGANVAQPPVQQAAGQTAVPDFKPNLDRLAAIVRGFNAQCTSASQSVVEECSKARGAAAEHCDPATSPEASGGADALNQISQSLSALGAQGRDGSGVLLACKGLVQAMSAGNAVYQAVQAACAGYRDTCIGSCKPTPDKIRKSCGPIEDAVGKAAEADLRQQYRDHVQKYAGNPAVIPEANYNFDPHIEQIQRMVERVSKETYAKLDQVPDQNLDQCKQLDSHIKDAQVAMNSLAQTGQAATMCGNQVSNLALPNYCNDNPNAPGCGLAAADCSNPQVAATDKICICRANPNGPGCGGIDVSSTNRNGPGSVIGGGPAETTSSSKGAAGLAGLTLGALDAMSNMLKGGSGGGDDSVGGSKGGAGAQGGGLSGGSGGAAGGGAAGDDAQHANILSGFRGGAGGGYGGTTGTYGSGEGLPAGSGYDNPAVTTYGNGPDLRQFLPGGQMDPQNRRGLAGVVGPDGITGPHSDLWRNVKNRYQSVESSLLP